MKRRYYHQYWWVYLRDYNSSPIYAPLQRLRIKAKTAAQAKHRAQSNRLRIVEGEPMPAAAYRVSHDGDELFLAAYKTKIIPEQKQIF